MTNGWNLCSQISVLLVGLVLVDGRRTYHGGCYPNLTIEFSGDRIQDYEYGHQITNLFVTTDSQRHIGEFLGIPSRLIIPHFAKADWGDDFIFYVVFATQNIPQDDAVLVSNAGCVRELPSIKLAVKNNNTLEGSIVTEAGQIGSVIVPFSVTGFNLAVFLYDGRVLSLAVVRPDHTQSRSEQPITGDVAARNCSLNIGYGSGSNFFRGYIDMVQVYMCR